MRRNGGGLSMTNRLRRFANVVYPLYAPLVHRIFRSDLFHHWGAPPNLTWLGNPIWQDPFTLWTLQETISELRPQLIIETGTNRGGSALFFAHLLDLLQIDNGRVVTVDIENLRSVDHPRVTWLVGDSTSNEIVTKVKAASETATGAVMVILDSNHTTEHVTKELNQYHRFVTLGSLLHVQDGCTSHWGRPLGPLRSIIDFLRDHPEFEVDERLSRRFLITRHPMGWLRRRSASSDGRSTEEQSRGRCHAGHPRSGSC
jgi:cephalosporin hydroxylase